MPKVIMMVGNIGSGKSTLVKHFAVKGYIVISRDALRYMVGSGEYIFDEDLEPSILRIEQFALRELTDAGYDIVIDETNVSLAMRNRQFDCFKGKGYEAIAVVMPRLPKDICIKRRMKDAHGSFGAKVWEGVWDRFDERYVEPTKEEGFNKVIHFKGDVFETFDAINV